MNVGTGFDLARTHARNVASISTAGNIQRDGRSDANATVAVTRGQRLRRERAETGTYNNANTHASR